MFNKNPKEYFDKNLCRVTAHRLVCEKWELKAWKKRNWQVSGIILYCNQLHNLHGVSVTWSTKIRLAGVLKGNAVQDRNSPRYCDTDENLCATGRMSGKVSISEDVKSGDLLIRFAITFGGRVKGICKKHCGFSPARQAAGDFFVVAVLWT